MKTSTQSIFYSKNLFLKVLLFSYFLFSFSTIRAQQYTERFTTTPVFITNPVVPTSKQTATVTYAGIVYEFVNSGNGGWEYKTSGGLSNSANLLYSVTAANSAAVTIKRQDGKRFQFYGAWLKYTNFAVYGPPWLKVSYDGSAAPDEVFGDNTTVLLSKNVNVISVTLTFSGLHNLNYDNIIVGNVVVPIPPFLPYTESVSDFSNKAATLGGSVTDDGGAPVTESGLVYGTSPTPTIADNKLPLSTDLSSFSQVVTGMQSATTYYVRSYAINSAGISYGNEETLTTFGTFTMAGTHNFNSPWVSTYYQASPYAKYIEGWDATGESTGSGLISMRKLTGSDAGEGAGSLSVSADMSIESLEYLSMKPNNHSYFNLQSFLFRYDVQDPGTSFAAITVKGYKIGQPVTGATQTLINIPPAGITPGYFTFTANPIIFENIDEFRVTASNSPNGAKLKSLDIDVITTAASVLPVTFTSVKAYKKNSGIQVEWNVAAESDVNHYEIEKSLNGQRFIRAFNLPPKSNRFSSANYNWLDERIFRDKNYYRVKCVFNSGEMSYSQVVNVAIGADDGSIAINPNPVTGGVFNLSLTNQPVGQYTIKLFNMSGQQLYSSTFEHQGGSSTRAVDVKSILSTGSYQLKVSGPSKSYKVQLIKMND